jgi:hypothetical protein
VAVVENLEDLWRVSQLQSKRKEKEKKKKAEELTKMKARQSCFCIIAQCRRQGCWVPCMGRPGIRPSTGGNCQVNMCLRCT